MAVTPSEYQMSLHVLAKIQDGSDPRDASAALIADVVTQRLQSHHRPSMEAVDDDTRLEMLIRLAPQVISMTLADDSPIDVDVGIIQTMTDDLVKLGIRSFAERYNNAVLIKIWDDIERRTTSPNAE
ncbi:hypothetical protein FHS96_005189 [Sphingomonas zeicaulis]|uniref:hypothetical protein n=1 Tax=Sphingomonas zeicaulis TaxID=1632740 RepID=UPI003D1B5E17